MSIISHNKDKTYPSHILKLSSVYYSPHNRSYKFVNISSQKNDSSLKISPNDREMAKLSKNVSFDKIKILYRPKITREKCKQSFNFISLILLSCEMNTKANDL